jgi:CheY-like chemotaxis protein
MLNILHLEDDGPLADIFNTAVSTMAPGITLHHFANSDQAVAFIDQHQHELDLFVLDIRVPGSLDGIEVARKIREVGSSAPIVITSAYAPPRRELLTELDSIWSKKPWHMVDMLNKVIPLAKKWHAEALAASAINAAPAETAPVDKAPSPKPSASVKPPATPAKPAPASRPSPERKPVNPPASTRTPTDKPTPGDET